MSDTHPTATATAAATTLPAATDPDLAHAAASADPAVGLRAAAALRRLAEQLEATQVRRARGLGWSWQDIATALGVSKQAVHKKHAGRGDRDA